MESCSLQRECHYSLFLENGQDSELEYIEKHWIEKEKYKVGINCRPDMGNATDD